MKTKRIELDLYQEVTDKILAALEKDLPPWVKPWESTDSPQMFPTNASSGRFYRGVNVWLLILEAAEKGYRDHRWLTYRQAQGMGGHVKKGEKATLVILWKPMEIEEKDEAGKKHKKKILLLRSFSVFNVQQCEGLQLPELAEAPKAPEVRYKEVQEFVEATKAIIRQGPHAAYYPGTDQILMPPLLSFKDEESYWGTALHELTHWTSHPARCNRELTGRFGDEAYAAEELVAEMGSAFLCAALGIRGELQHPQYLKHWIRILQNDKRAIFKASTLAQQAADHLLGCQPETEEEEAP